MTIEHVQLADFLREELHRFLYVSVRQNEEAGQVATEQLWSETAE
jgi:hypothetical protein